MQSRALRLRAHSSASRSRLRLRNRQLGRYKGQQCPVVTFIKPELIGDTTNRLPDCPVHAKRQVDFERLIYLVRFTWSVKHQS